MESGGPSGGVGLVSSNRISGLIHQGKLKDGFFLGVVVHGNVFGVGVATTLGIKCCCCSKVFTVIEFEVHAGSKAKKGSLRIFVLDGSLKSLAFLRDNPLSNMKDEGESLQASKRRSLGKENSSCDMCSLEEVDITCHNSNCPTSFHLECSGLKDIPDREWYCQKCTCRLCLDTLRRSQATHLQSLLLCTMCGDEYHTSCASDADTLKFCKNVEWFCSEYCKEGFEFIENNLESFHFDDFSKISLVRWTGHQSIYSTNGDGHGNEMEALKQKGEEAKKLFQAFHILKMSFKEERKPHQFQKLLYPMSPEDKLLPTSHDKSVDHYGFFTWLLEKDGQVMTIATIRIHSHCLAEMPFIATLKNHRKQGFCYKFMKHLQEVLKKMQVRMLVIKSPEKFVDMWITRFSMKKVQNNDDHDDVKDDVKRSILMFNLLKTEKRTLLYMTV